MTAKYGLQNVDVSYCLVKKWEEESHYESLALESASKIDLNIHRKRMSQF